MGVAATIVSWILHEGFWAAFSLPKRANFERVTARDTIEKYPEGRKSTDGSPLTSDASFPLHHNLPACRGREGSDRDQEW